MLVSYNKPMLCQERESKRRTERKTGRKKEVSHPASSKISILTYSFLSIFLIPLKEVDKSVPHFKEPLAILSFYNYSLIRSTQMFASL